jgi:acyl-CoA reductase-like NAD-dependent aldehyde dehydrogenase
MKRESHVPTVFKHYLNGGWVTSATTGLSMNPSDLDEPIGEYVRADARQVDAAIDAASAAWREWSRASANRRAQALDAIGAELLARRTELGRLLAREQGKTLPKAIDEAVRAGQIFQFFANEALRDPGEHRRALQDVHSGTDIDIDVIREPVGVAGIITPWSFPLSIPAAKIAAALSLGNCVVFKPAELVPGCAWALADVISRSGLPAGVFNLVLGSGRQAGARIVANPAVHAVSFTGSAATGQAVLQAGAARRARIQLDTGGKSALIVLDDANLTNAVDAAIHSSYSSNGQSCMASSTLIVERGIYARFVDAMTAQLATQCIDHALKKGVDMGPVADETQFKRNLETIAAASREGAELLHGGRPLERATRGYFLEPALFAGTPDMAIAREESFGPIAVVVPADDYAHALHVANDTLSAVCTGLCTTSLKHARHFRRNSLSDAVTVNLPTTAAEQHWPADGANDLGAVPFFTRTRTAHVAG